MKKNKIIFALFCIFIVVFSGKYMYIKERGFSKFENFEKIPQYIIDETYYISQNNEEKVKVIVPTEPWESCMMRQYSTKIILLHSRLNSGIDDEYKKLYEELYYNSDQIENSIFNTLYFLVKKYNVDYIILSKARISQELGNFQDLICSENQNNYILSTRELKDWNGEENENKL